MASRHDRAAHRRGNTVRPPQTSEAEQALRRIVRGLRVASRQVESSAPVSAAQLFVLQKLAEAPFMSLRELAERTMTDRTSVAHLLDRLEAQDYVERRRCKTDRRRSEIICTRLGRALLSRAPLSPTAQLLQALARLSPSELRSLTVGLRRLADEMSLSAGPAPILFADTAEGARTPQGPIARPGSR